MPDIDLQKKTSEKNSDICVCVYYVYIYIYIYAYDMVFHIKSSSGTSSSGHDIVQQPMPTRLTKSTTPILSTVVVVLWGEERPGSDFVGPGKAEDLYAYLMYIYIHIQIYSTYI